MNVHVLVFSSLTAALVAGCVSSNPAWDPPSETGEGELGSGTDSGAGETVGAPPWTGSSDSGSWTGDGSPDDDDDAGDGDSQPGDGDGDGQSGDGQSGDGDDATGDGDGDHAYVCDEAAPSYGPCPPGCDECHAGVCWRFCGDGECHDDFMLCPVSWSCRVACLGKDSCKNATVACTGWGSCEVDCMGDSACMDADILCAAGPCNVTCGAGHDKPCEHTEVWCGGNRTRLHCEEPYEGSGPVLTPTNKSDCGCTSDCVADKS